VCSSRRKNVVQVVGRASSCGLMMIQSSRSDVKLQGVLGSSRGRRISLSICEVGQCGAYAEGQYDTFVPPLVGLGETVCRCLPCKSGSVVSGHNHM